MQGREPDPSNQPPGSRVPTTRPAAAFPARILAGRALAMLLVVVAMATGPVAAAVADPAANVEQLAVRIAAVDDELAELAETFAVLDVREAEARRELDRATSRVDRLTEQRAATRALHLTQLGLAHRRTTVEQVDEALHLLATRSGLVASRPDREAARLDGPGTVQVPGVHGAPVAATSVSLGSGSPAVPHAGHLQRRYAARASLVFAALHVQLAEAEEATVAPRHQLDNEVAPARARLQDRLQGLLQARDELASSLAFERSLLERGDRLQLPVTAAHRVSSRFGMRRHPIHGDVRMHTGLDLAAPIGTPVSAAAAGRVVAAGSRGGYGLTVDIDHGGGLLTRYAHLNRIEVERGDRLAAGQRLGTVGMTGTVTGPHLHLEVREHGRAVDPADWLVGARGRA